MLKKYKLFLSASFLLSLYLIIFVSAINCPSNITIFSGDTYNGEIIVKNTASTAGSFILSINCNNSNVDGIGSELFFGAGEEKGLSFSITGTNINTQNLIAECTYTVIDRKSGLTDTDKGIVIVKYQANIICSPNSVTCQDSNILRTCSDDGITYEDTKCNSGCQVLQDGTALCKITEGNIFLYIIIFILFVIILLAIIFKTKKKK